MGTVFIALLPEATRAVFELFGSALIQLFSTRAMEVKNCSTGSPSSCFSDSSPMDCRVLAQVRRYWNSWPFMY